MEVYFDNAATTKVRDEAIEAMLHVMRDEYGNPSSTHFMGRRAADVMKTARKNVADALGASSSELIFTSGGTEADNWVVSGCVPALVRKGKHIITSAIEHDAVMEPIRKLESQGWDVTYLAPGSGGVIQPESFAAALREDTVFASIMLVNNETGAVNPIGEFAKEIKRRGFDTVLHTDAVQGFCKIPFTMKTLGAQLVTVSAHKIHGPKGIGALYVKNGVKLQPMIFGGLQENEKRAGTESMPAIAGFGEAARLGCLAQGETAAAVSKIREYIIETLASELPEAVIIGEGGSPFILSLALPGHRSEVLMSFLEAEGICVSKSAACKKGARSRVLEAMRLEKAVLDGAVRVSFSRYSTEAEAQYFVETLKKASQKLLKAL
ncbi:MAG: cysteine desulfurase [Oscillospiraceae bacterium]|nr:cysteine desulfurase [Oscillospiraceae bacterium]